MQHSNVVQGLRVMYQMLHGEMQGRRVCKHAAGGLPDANRSRPLCRTHSTDIQCVLDHIRLPWIQLNPSGNASVPTDPLSGAAAQPPGQAAVPIPYHLLSLTHQTEGAFFTQQHLAWGWTGCGTRIRVLWRTGTRLRARSRLRPAGRRLRRRGKRAELQHLFQLAFQQHLILCHRLHQGGDAFVDCQHILGTGAVTCAMQGAQDILQLLGLRGIRCFTRRFAACLSNRKEILNYVSAQLSHS